MGKGKKVLPRTDLFSVYGNGASMFPSPSTRVWKRERERAKNRRRRRLGKRAIIYFQGGRRSNKDLRVKWATEGKKDH